MKKPMNSDVVLVFLSSSGSDCNSSRTSEICSSSIRSLLGIYYGVSTVVRIVLLWKFAIISAFELAADPQSCDP